MTAMILHCQKEFWCILNKTKNNNNLVFDAFSALEESIKTLDTIDQLEWYGAATQVLTSLAHNKSDPLNPMDVFSTKANFIMHGKNPTARAFGLGLAVLVIGLGTLIAAAAAGVGIMMLIGLWTTPMGFIASLIALETAPLVITAVAPVLALGAATLSSVLFFKKPAVERAFENCVEAIKESHLAPVHALKDRDISYQDTNWHGDGQSNLAKVI